MESLLQRLLHHYSIHEEDFALLTAEPSFSRIPTLPLTGDVLRAKERILQAIARNEKTLVYGDYDTDGIMSASIICHCFHALHGTAAPFIPSRYEDGYGLSMKNAIKIASAGYRLVILVDNGVSSAEEIAYLQSKGADVIILDHHELPAKLPEPYAFLHPKTLSYGKEPISAGCLSFLFSIALLDRRDDYLMLLGALSTLSDLMPLRSHNRELVRLAIDYANATRPVELEYLAEHFPYDEKVLSLEVIPAINAIGRLCKDHKGMRLVHYFADRDHSAQRQTALWMKGVNDDRKALTKSAGEAVAVDEGRHGIVALCNTPEGLNGLVANRLLSLYKRPVAVFSPSEADPSCYVGSLRSEEGFSIIEAYEALSPLLVRYGGHSFAGGCSIKKEDFERFSDAFEEFAKDHPITKATDAIPLELSECTVESFDLIQAFRPFGMEWKEPKFLLKDLDVSSFSYTRDGRFLSTPLSYGVKLFSFAVGKKELEGRERVDLLVSFEENEFRGRKTVMIKAEKAL